MKAIQLKIRFIDDVDDWRDEYDRLRIHRLASASRRKEPDHTKSNKNKINYKNETKNNN